MKKLVSLLGVCGFALIGAQTGFAANVANNTNLETEGTINFTPGPPIEGDLHKPDEKGEEPLIIDMTGEGNNGAGNLRIQFVPHFRFGQHQKIDAGEATEKVSLLEYSEQGSATKTKIAPFVQVTDSRGESGAKAHWALSVVATPFETTLDGGKKDVLTGVKLKLNGSTLTMDYHTSAAATADFIQGQGANAVILSDGVSSIEVMKTKAGASTSGYQASNVFFNNYQKEGTYAEAKNDGVEFYKPAGQAPYADKTYRSTLKWTLADAL